MIYIQLTFMQGEVDLLASYETLATLGIPKTFYQRLPLF